MTHRFPQGRETRSAVPWLLAIGALSTALYALIWRCYPLLDLYAKQRFVLKNYTQSNPTTGAAMAAVAVALFALYGLGWYALRTRGQGGRGALALLLLFPALAVGLLLLTQPITSTDLYDYLFSGRMAARYGANTFVVPPNQYSSDSLYLYVVWRNAVTAYGPLWVAMSHFAAWLAGERPGAPDVTQLLSLIFAYKLLAVLGYALCGAAIWLALGRIAPQHRRTGLYIWLWNPMALWETVAVGHNDVWLILPIVLAVWLAAPSARAPREQVGLARPWWAMVSLTLGALIKYLALLYAPLVLVSSLRRMPTWRRRTQLLVLGGLACAALIVLAYAPYWAGADTFINFANRKSLYNATWLAAARPLLVAPFGEEGAKDVASGAGMALLVLGALWATWRSFRAPELLARHMIWLTLWFFFVANPWFQPWYALWALALVALVPGLRHTAWAVALMCMTGTLTYMATTFVLPRWGLHETESLWHVLLSALVYGPPLLVLAWGWAAPRWGRAAAQPRAARQGAA